jgi:hypothetical protein
MDSGIQDVNLQYLCRIHSKVKKYAKKTFDRDRVMFFLSIMPADEYDQPSNSPINTHKLNHSTLWFYDILCTNLSKEYIYIGDVETHDHD